MPATGGNGSSSLLGTPQARDWKGAPADGYNSGSLWHSIALLPTPRASDGPKGGPGQVNGRGIPDSLPAIEQLLLKGQMREAGPAGNFGPYRAAVERWAVVLGRPAPPPVNAGRLNPRFVEWMMGLPEGHVTDLPNIPNSAALKALGNGVVPQQALLALNLLDPR